ncbi:hypothetical protein BURKHO8Y_140355 [Burkholderia sp. 8Y]|nr:hypothetical protein BURKHO8Y_140355 [Burkholderia sp. 8Y]
MTFVAPAALKSTCDDLAPPDSGSASIVYLPAAEPAAAKAIGSVALYTPSYAGVEGSVSAYAPESPLVLTDATANDVPLKACNARIVALDVTGVTVPVTVWSVEAGREIGADELETTVVEPALTGTDWMTPVAKPFCTITTSYRVLAPVCGRGVSMKLPFESATVPRTTTPFCSANTVAPASVDATAPEMDPLVAVGVAVTTGFRL